MEHGDKIVKILTVFMYIDAVAFALLRGLVLDEYRNNRMAFLIALFGVLSVALLCILKVDTQRRFYRFSMVSTLLFTGMTSLGAVEFDMPYMFVVYQLLLVLCFISSLKKKVFLYQMMLNIIVAMVMTFAFGSFSVPESSTIVCVFLIEGWISYIFAERNSKLLRLLEDENQSREDMMSLVEARFAEEKGANIAKSSFLANMSHEIRTPINAIMGMNSMILRDSKEDETKDKAHEIENASKTLLSLINDILDLSKVESGKMEVVPVEYDLSTVIYDVTNMISFKAKNKQLELIVNVDENLPDRLYGDDVRIRQILINILNNAVKYTERGSVTLDVTGHYAGDLLLLKCNVTDTGIGIKEEDMTKLFANFERIDVVRNRNVEGTGLGMAITQRLLNLMGSKLEVLSTYGVGSSFFFYLPQRIVDFTPINEVNADFAKDEVEENDVAYVTPDASYLVVDDNQVNRVVFKGLLKPSMASIDEAESGYEALRMLAEKKYDVVFLDHMMPGMDGVETLHTFREANSGPNVDTPFVALTANAVSGAKEMYLESGFQGYLSKPLDPVKLERMLIDFLPDDKRIPLEDLPEDVREKAKEANAKAAASAANGQETIELPLIEGVDWESAKAHLGTQETIMTVVESFYKAIKSEADYLEEMYNRLVTSADDEEAWELYRIKVHAMKSSANMFGLFVLGGPAATLEYAARDGRLDQIIAVTPFFIESWRAYKEKLSVLFPEENVEKIEASDDAEVMYWVGKMISSAETFDCSGMDEVLEKLRVYSVSEEFDNKFNELENAVINLDTDEVIRIGNEMVELLG